LDNVFSQKARWWGEGTIAESYIGARHFYASLT
jgi:hypothetical protein